VGLDPKVLRCFDKWCALGALVGAAGLLFGLVSTQDARATLTASPAQLLRSAFADDTARGSFHFAASTVQAGKTVTFSDDVALDEGRQIVTISGGARFSALVVAGVAYMSGNETALVDYFGFSAAVAREVGERWISVPRSSSAYADVAGGVTVSSALAQITPAGTLTETAPTTLDGQAVIGVSGRLPAAYGQPGSMTTYVIRGSSPLPVLMTITLRASGHVSAGHGSASVSDWGEHVTVSAPTNAIPLSKIG